MGTVFGLDEMEELKKSMLEHQRGLSHLEYGTKALSSMHGAPK